MVFSAKVVIIPLAPPKTAKYSHSKKLGYWVACFGLQAGTQHSLQKAEVKRILPKAVLGIQKN